MILFKKATMLPLLIGTLAAASGCQVGDVGSGGAGSQPAGSGAQAPPAPPPQVAQAVSATASPAQVVEPGLVRIRATASSGVARVQFYRGGQLLGDQPGTEASFNVVFAATRQASDRFEVRALNAGGEVVATTTLDVAVNIPNRILYVAGDGNDANDGLSEARPKRTLRAVTALTVPGDFVLVRNGTYTEANPNADILTITRSGAPNAWITYAGYPGEAPRLQAENWNAIRVRASYIAVRGLTLVGNRERVTLAYAQSEAGNLGNPITSGNGVQVLAVAGEPRPHHVRIANNRVEDFPGGCIAVSQSDYITIEDNQVYRCGWYSPYGNSGISIYQSWNSDASTGVKMIVRRNISAFNQNLVPFFYSGSTPAERKVTDGNGIIIDDSRNTQNGSTLGPYNGRFLIENNLVYSNGGRGLIVFLSDHATIANNSAWRNAQHASIPSELNVVDSSDVRVFNSIFLAATDRQLLNVARSTQVSFASNLFFGGSGLPSAIPSGNAFADPRFVDPAQADFRLGADSPAIDAGQLQDAPSSDLVGVSRPQGAGVDIGAYEAPR